MGKKRRSFVWDLHISVLPASRLNIELLSKLFYDAFHVLQPRIRNSWEKKIIVN